MVQVFSPRRCREFYFNGNRNIWRAFSYLLRFEHLYRLDLARLAFKTSRKRIPDDIAFRLDPVLPIRPTRRQTEFIKPRALTGRSRQTVQFRLPEIWSSIPTEIRNIAGARKFRREVKDRLLSE